MISRRRKCVSVIGVNEEGTYFRRGGNVHHMASGAFIENSRRGFSGQRGGIAEFVGRPIVGCFRSVPDADAFRRGEGHIQPRIRNGKIRVQIGKGSGGKGTIPEGTPVSIANPLG